MTRPRNAPSRNIASLDGLRAVSIGLVLFAHSLGTENFLPLSALKGILEPGRLGVRVFFVISGYLITSLLLLERERTGRISLGAFYARRAIRILPAFAAFLVCVGLLSYFGEIVLPRHNLIYAATYTLNLTRAPGSWWTGHLWSLAVEEQFYLVWPAVVAFCSRRTAIVVALFAAGVPPILRALVLSGRLPVLDGLSNAFPLVADDLALGCLAALFSVRFSSPFWRRLLQGNAIYLVPPAILLACTLEFHPRICPPLLFISLVTWATGLGITIVVVRFTRYSMDWGGKLLNSAPLKTVGLLSYSVYLWQQLFLNHNAHSILQTFPLTILCIAMVSTASFRCIETPFLRLRKHFSPSVSPATAK
jgi:peptidoglycan/LPS O-acetylase OafA/YrhL